MRILNITSAELEPQPDEPASYRCSQSRIGPTLGASKMGATIYALAPGTAICPYHYESEGEWLLVLSGAITLRHPEGEAILKAGDITAFPTGPDGAHKTTHHGPAPARVVMFSTNEPIGYCVYPDCCPPRAGVDCVSAEAPPGETRLDTRVCPRRSVRRARRVDAAHRGRAHRPVARPLR